jgi:hypothetical protein
MQWILYTVGAIWGVSLMFWIVLVWLTIRDDRRRDYTAAAEHAAEEAKKTPASIDWDQLQIATSSTAAEDHADRVENAGLQT